MTKRKRTLKLTARLLAFTGVVAISACTAELSTPEGTGDDSGPNGNGTKGPDSTPRTFLPFEAQPGLVPRLTRSQFRNALFDLLDVQIDVNDLEADSHNGEFANVGASTVVTSNSGAEQYLSVVETAVEELFTDVEKRSVFIGCTPVAGDDACTREFLTKVGRRAWRRPLSPEELDRLSAVAQVAQQELASPVEGMRWATTALLSSPNFLYRPEIGTPMEGEHRIVGYEMASRLAFLLWNTLPDEQLLDEAESGALSTIDGVVTAARRMLDAPLGREAVAAFAEDYMRLDRIAIQAKDPDLYPEYNAALKQAMAVDMREIWARVAFDDDESALNLFSTRRVFANAELAEVYGIDPAGLDSSTFKEFLLPEGAQRSGILSKAGFLSQFANQVEGSPTLRGKFIREALLCTTVPKPPPNLVLEIPEAAPDMPTTKRDRLDLHRSKPGCASCHALMDPLGLPLEQFDAIGRYRTTELGLMIDATGEFDGVAVSDAQDLGEVMSSSQTISECLVRKYFAYALGREEEKTDEGTLAGLFESFEVSGHRMRELVLQLAATEAFFKVAPQP